MKKIRFAETHQDGVIVYPDDTSKFSNITATGGFVYADYTGDLSLEEVATPAATTRKLSKLAFINLFTDAEYVAILTAAKQSVLVEAWLKKFEMTSVEPDGASIDITDERTIAGVQALEAAGLIGAGRAEKILKGH